mmetsp:Transcript_12841/g.31504  ORF Transcript_12841/g.31504 Transcript_12841/m.31504 type:complete len:224 (-) Transcript_12841:416-1087(-)
MSALRWGGACGGCAGPPAALAGDARSCGAGAAPVMCGTQRVSTSTRILYTTTSTLPPKGPKPSPPSSLISGATTDARSQPWSYTKEPPPADAASAPSAAPTSPLGREPSSPQSPSASTHSSPSATEAGRTPIPVSAWWAPRPEGADRDGACLLCEHLAAARAGGSLLAEATPAAASAAVGAAKGCAKAPPPAAALPRPSGPASPSSSDCDATDARGWEGMDGL